MYKNFNDANFTFIRIANISAYLTYALVDIFDNSFWLHIIIRKNNCDFKNTISPNDRCLFENRIIRKNFIYNIVLKWKKCMSVSYTRVSIFFYRAVYKFHRFFYYTSVRLISQDNRANSRPFVIESYDNTVILKRSIDTNSVYIIRIIQSIAKKQLFEFLILSFLVRSFLFDFIFLRQSMERNKCDTRR